MESRSRSILCAGIVSAGLALPACGGSAPAEPPQPPAAQDTVFGDAVGTLDRARATQEVTTQHKQAVDQAIEQSSGDGAAAGSP